MSPEPATVFIVDDDFSVCRSLARLVRQAGLRAETFGSAEEFLRLQTDPLTRPACAVVDLHMPGLSGIELQKRLCDSPAACPVIFISGNGDIPSTVQAMRQGAVTFLTKPFDTTELLHAIEEALRKHRASMVADHRASAILARVNDLTEREIEVMAWIITGALNKQIAAELNIVEKTVKVHRARVLEKMQVSSVAELVRVCAVVNFAPAKAAERKA
ncbi:MAG: response regulator transcription factor [Prosthecobacter sp.]|uniref:response regulator transcription factor n=1 Tax=Prosthecobacter sp. TaxID=1965333 RepID=UPI0019EB2279|nr:response regulator [Prosthecobacter sp.]MBE2285128.1 response regulator transcription factor [Prosthecobacter sp.]